MRSLLNFIQTFIRTNFKLIVVAGVSVFFGLGLAAVYATAIDYTNRLDFCAHTCHEMESTVYSDYIHSRHFKNEHGVVVVCAQCHVPQNNWPLTFGHKVLATFELWDHFVGREYIDANFAKRRYYLAQKVLAGFKDTNARECKACHKYSNMLLDEQRPSIRAQHVDAMKTDENCLDCHQGITHKKQVDPNAPKPAKFDL